MKYQDILQFDPITEVVQFNLLDDREYQRNLVRTFVYPDYFLETIIPEIVKNLKFGEKEQKGIQIIGNYGTGKSHLMSLIQLVGEYPEYLDEVQSDKAQEILKPIAGKFKVHRFEMQQDSKLWAIVTYQLQRFLDANGIDYQFEETTLKMYHEQLEEMMAAFEEKFPDKGFLLVIDEMLSYLKGHVASGLLDQDLAVLQALGQACNKGRFCFMFGVQEMIYQAREFQFAAEMLRKVKDRYRDLTIRREDVAFVVQNRLLGKTEQQKKQIRLHLEPFTKYFADMHAKMEEYVNLFPVHPSYFENFQKIRLGQSQREVLKTLSRQFERIKDENIPTDNPGLITYDQYWEQMMGDAAMMTEPDFKRVADTVKIVHDKIQNNFEGVRKRQAPLAKRIANACAIKILQGELSKRNGATASTLVDDLCCTFALMEDREFLIDQVSNCANYIIRATSGQYFDKDEDSNEYRLRTEGGINIDEQIREHAELNMAPISKDKAFYKFMVQILQIDSNPYRTGFEIYKHEIVWQSHRITRDGYIFFGGTHEKSTTQPKQHFYMIFMPIFQQDKKQRTDAADEVYFVMDGLSQEFKDAVCLYGAAFTLYTTATSDRKALYYQKMEELFKKARIAFDACYLQHTRVYYVGEDARAMQHFNLPGGGASKMEIFNAVASNVFEDYLTSTTPHYPIFANARQVITNENIGRMVKAALTKLARPNESQQDGEMILSGLGLWHAGEIKSENSIYAEGVLRKMEERDDNMVVNRDELLAIKAQDTDKGIFIWRSTDYDIEANFQFIVLAALTALGDCEIKMHDGKTINAANINEITTLNIDELHNFAFIKRPKGVNIPLIREITKVICGEDLSNRLDRQETYSRIVNDAKSLAKEVATFIGTTLTYGAVEIAGVSILSEEDIRVLKINTAPLKGLADKMATYTSEAKIKNLQLPLDEVKTVLASYKEMTEVKKKISLANRLNTEVSYLNQAKQYVPSGTELASDLDTTIGYFGQVLAKPTQSVVSGYEAELRQLKDKYISWYLKRYYDYCLSEIDMQKKTQIMNSPEYQVCIVLSDLTIINTSLWRSWSSMFYSLKPADPNVENALQSSPYHNFNPLTERDTEIKSLGELKDELGILYQTWIEALKDYISSDDSQAALKLMSHTDRNYAQSFTSGLSELTDTNSARAMIQFIDMLSRGLDPVEFDHDSIAKYFNRAMTIEEAKATFETMIEQMSLGKKRDKVRIIFK